jgi:HEAT repeat protein
VRIVASLAGLLWLAVPLSAAPPAPTEGELIARLIASLRDPDPDVRANLAQALAKIGPTAVESLSDALADALPERRAGAATALGLMGTSAKGALPKLLELLDDKENEVRRQASQAIVRVLPSSKPPAKPTGDR